jgi:hypothetical protein
MAYKDNLIAWWTMEETSGNRADASGNSNTLTDYNTVGYGTGKVGNGADFERDDTEHLSRASTASLLMSDIDFTIAFWMKAESIPGVCYLISKGSSTSSNTTMAYRSYLNAEKKIVFHVFNNTSVAGITSGALLTGTWYFVVLYHDSVNDLIGYSINAAAPTTASCTIGCLDSVNFPQKVGISPNVVSSGEAGFDGILDEVSIWKRMLTADEITWLYNAGNGRTYTELDAPTGGTGLLISNILDSEILNSRIVR